MNKNYYLLLLLVLIVVVYLAFRTYSTHPSQPAAALPSGLPAGAKPVTALPLKVTGMTVPIRADYLPPRSYYHEVSEFTDVAHQNYQLTLYPAMAEQNLTGPYDFAVTVKIVFVPAEEFKPLG